VNYLEAYLSRLELWLWDWKISISVSKSTDVLFTNRYIQGLRPIQFLGQPITWVKTTRYLGVTIDTRFR
jgi:hypothetical protein